jgi:hypothetical protein
MENKNEVKYRKAQERVEELKAFYSHASIYVLVMGLLAIFNVYTSNFFWVVFPAVGWGIGLLSHGLATFGHGLLFGKNWEQRKIKQLMESDEL